VAGGDFAVMPADPARQVNEGACRVEEDCPNHRAVFIEKAVIPQSWLVLFERLSMDDVDVVDRVDGGAMPSCRLLPAELDVAAFSVDTS
jgi:hypothetical protein